MPAATCVKTVLGGEIGRGDGTPTSVTITELYATPEGTAPVDLAFNLERKEEVWVIGYGDDSAHVGTGLDTDAPSFKRFIDPAAGHFMHKPPALAMGSATQWATCGDNDNSQNGEANLFMGPATFTTDLSVFSKRTSGGLGSHFDMLHGSPFCRGVAHATGGVYWVFNNYDKSIDKYDFAKEHEPGGDDHSDGSIFRYARGQVKGASDGTPSHLFFDPEDNFLYVADTGNQRIVRLDTTTGKRSGPLPRKLEPLKESGVMTNAVLEVVIEAGLLQKPSGLEIRGGLLYVTDAETSKFHVFDKSGEEIRSLETGLPAGSLAGFAFGPGDKIFFTDRVSGKVCRLDPK